jgi:hypothetical protein
VPHPQHLAGSLLDDASDRMSVCRPTGERLQNQHVPSALQQFELAVSLSSRHSN